MAGPTHLYVVCSRSCSIIWHWFSFSHQVWQIFLIQLIHAINFLHPCDFRLFFLAIFHVKLYEHFAKVRKCYYVDNNSWILIFSPMTMFVFSDDSLLPSVGVTNIPSIICMRSRVPDSSVWPPIWIRNVFLPPGLPISVYGLSPDFVLTEMWHCELPRIIKLDSFSLQYKCHQLHH